MFEIEIKDNVTPHLRALQERLADTSALEARIHWRIRADPRLRHLTINNGAGPGWARGNQAEAVAHPPKEPDSAAAKKASGFWRAAEKPATVTEAKEIVKAIAIEEAQAYLDGL